LSKTANFNPAEALISAAAQRKLPSNVHHNAYSFFSKVQVPSIPQMITETYKLKDVTSPPFPTEENTSYALVASSSSSIRGARSALYRTKNRLLNIYGGD